MPVPNYSILRVEKEDLPFIANFIRTAKLRLSINRLLFQDWPNEPIQTRMYTRAVTSGFEDPSTESFKAVDTASNEIIGYSVLARKRPAQEKPKYDLSTSSAQDTPEGLNPALFAEVMTASVEIAKETENMDHFGKHAPVYVKLNIANIEDRIGFHVCEALFAGTWNWIQTGPAGI